MSGEPSSSNEFVLSRSKKQIDNWNKNILYNSSWNQVLHDGFFRSNKKTQIKNIYSDYNSSASRLSSSKSVGFEMVLSITQHICE